MGMLTASCILFHGRLWLRLRDPGQQLDRFHLDFANLNNFEFNREANNYFQFAFLGRKGHDPRLDIFRTPSTGQTEIEAPSLYFKVTTIEGDQQRKVFPPTKVRLDKSSGLLGVSAFAQAYVQLECVPLRLTREKSQPCRAIRTRCSGSEKLRHSAAQFRAMVFQSRVLQWQLCRSDGLH